MVLLFPKQSTEEYQVISEQQILEEKEVYQKALEDIYNLVFENFTIPGSVREEIYKIIVLNADIVPVKAVKE
jgi:hypothetical protein